MDNINHPSHYETGKFECIEVMQEVMGVEAVKNFCVCNAFKYLYRHKNKNGIEDLKKADWYIRKMIELSEETCEAAVESKKLDNEESTVKTVKDDDNGVMLFIKECIANGNDIQHLGDQIIIKLS